MEDILIDALRQCDGNTEIPPLEHLFVKSTKKNPEFDKSKLMAEYISDTYRCEYTKDVRDLIRVYENGIFEGCSKNIISELLKFIFTMKTLVSELNHLIWKPVEEYFNTKHEDLYMCDIALRWYDERDNTYNYNLTYLSMAGLKYEWSDIVLGIQFSDDNILTDWRKYSAVNFYVSNPLEKYKRATLNCKNHANYELTRLSKLTQHCDSIDNYINYLLLSNMLKSDGTDDILIQAIKMLDTNKLIDIIDMLNKRSK